MFLTQRTICSFSLPHHFSPGHCVIFRIWQRRLRLLYCTEMLAGVWKSCLKTKVSLNQEWFRPSVICLTKCTFFRSGTSRSLRRWTITLVPTKIFLRVNHPCLNPKCHRIRDLKFLLVYLGPSRRGAFYGFTMFFFFFFFFFSFQTHCQRRRGRQLLLAKVRMPVAGLVYLPKCSTFLPAVLFTLT